MKYRTKMILSYMSIAIVFSLLLGIVVYTISSRYEKRSREEALNVSARQLVTQLEDRLGRMDAIMNYILSDPSILRSITILGRGDTDNVPPSYLIDAEADISVGLTTDYIIHNTHRSVFYNQNGSLLSSYAPDVSNQRLNEDFSIDELDYLPVVEEAKGKSVLIGAHEDRFGMYDGAVVYSLAKALQGNNMGFLETENTVESLKDLDVADANTDYCIMINDGERLFSSSPDLEELDTAEILSQLEGKDSIVYQGYITAGVSSDLYKLSVLTFRKEGLPDGQGTLILTATLSSLVVFAIGLIFVLIWSYVMVKPVTKLRGIMENTNLENLGLEGASAVLTDSPDEFRGLAQSYQAMTERLNKAVLNERRSSLLTLQAQFDTLQTQVNPHFIYNVLNIISGRGLMDDDTEICRMCGALAEMLRYSTSNKERYAYVSQELKYLDNYFYLIKTRYEDRFEYAVDIEEGVGEKLIPKMVLQQLVENSLSHGFENSDASMRIDIEGRMHEGSWTIAVSDNGEGFLEEKLKELEARLEETRVKVLNLKDTVEVEIGGMGLVNTYARCLLLFGPDLIFEIHNTGSGAEVVVGEKINVKNP